MQVVVQEAQWYKENGKKQPKKEASQCQHTNSKLAHKVLINTVVENTL